MIFPMNLYSVYFFILNEIRTPWFPRMSMKFLKPSKTRHGIFGDSDEMEFDDSDTWPLSELIRLDNINIEDDKIIFSMHSNIHPLEHASALVTMSSSNQGKLSFLAW
jgi:hypothetical protein